MPRMKNYHFLLVPRLHLSVPGHRLPSASWRLPPPFGCQTFSSRCPPRPRQPEGLEISSRGLSGAIAPGKKTEEQCNPAGFQRHARRGRRFKHGHRPPHASLGRSLGQGNCIQSRWRTDPARPKPKNVSDGFRNGDELVQSRMELTGAQRNVNSIHCRLALAIIYVAYNLVIKPSQLATIPHHFAGGSMDVAFEISINHLEGTPKPGGNQRPPSHADRPA